MNLLPGAFKWHALKNRNRKELLVFALKVHGIFSGKKVWIDDLDSVRCNKSDIRKFAEEAKQIGVQYVGLCCGNSPNLTREIAEVYGKNPPASKNRCDMSKSFTFGNDQTKFEGSLRKVKYMTGEINN